MDTAFQQQLVALADDLAAQGAGLSSATWAQAPTAYVGVCPSCQRDQILVKGPLAVYGMRGVYECLACTAVYRVGDWPTVLAHRVPPPPPPASIPPAEVADVLVQERHRRQQYLHELAAYLCWSRIHDDADGSP